jgi:hypothetical protein
MAGAVGQRKADWHGDAYGLDWVRGEYTISTDRQNGSMSTSFTGF